MDDGTASTLTQPLLSLDENDDEPNHQSKTKSHTCYFGCTLLSGAVLGFFIQVISLGACALMTLRWGSNNNDDNNNESHRTFETTFSTDWFLYIALSILTQIDLCIYVMIWLFFSCSITSRDLYSVFEKLSMTKRFVFQMCVYFIIGVVLGAFGAWTMIDGFLNFEVPFMPIVVTVLVDLTLCCLLLFRYDTQEIRDDDRDIESD